jgi:hypothetical protein
MFEKRGVLIASAPARLAQELEALVYELYEALGSGGRRCASKRAPVKATAADLI